MESTSDICESISKMIYRFKNVFVRCKVVTFVHSTNYFNEQEVKDFIDSVHVPGRCDISFQLCFIF